MPTNARDARRRRILQGGQDRLNLITGRASNVPSIGSEDDIITAVRGQSPPLVSQDLDPVLNLSDHLPDKPTDKIVSRLDQPAEFNQNGGYGGVSREDANLRRRVISNDPPKASSSEVRVRPESSAAARGQPVSASRPEQLLAPLVNFLGSITSQQLNSAVSATEQSRRLLSITMSLLVLLSYFGFPIVGNKIIKTIILFRPLLLLSLMNTSLVVLRLLADLDRRHKDTPKSSASEGSSWAEEAGRALEVGLMLQNVLGSIFMDFSVYALIIVCGFCLAG